VIIMSEVKTSRKLLVSEILRGDPCYTYSQRLRERFNVEIDVTVELAVSQADDWDWYWAASRLLTTPGYEKFSATVNKAENEQSDALKPYRDLARQAREEARNEYNRVLAIEVEKPGNWYSDKAYQAANEAYGKMTQVADAALTAARKVLEGRTNLVAAEAFALLYIEEDGTTDQTGNDKWYGHDDYEDSDYYEDDTDY
jgi:hypothetical protein